MYGGKWRVIVFPSDSDRIYFSFSNSKCTSHHFGVFPMIFKIQRKWLNRARSKGNRSLNSSVYLTRLGRGAIHCGWIVPILYLFILWAANNWARHYYFIKISLDTRLYEVHQNTKLRVCHARVWFQIVAGLYVHLWKDMEELETPAFGRPLVELGFKSKVNL